MVEGAAHKEGEKIQILKQDHQKQTLFSVEIVVQKETNIKGLFKYFTGITYVRFMALLAFLVPANSNVSYSKGRQDTKSLCKEDGLVSTLCRLRHNYGLQDTCISLRFGLSLQSAGVAFNTWIELIYFKFGQLSIWPHRDVIIKNMPQKFRKEFPSTLVIIDGTDFKTQVPSALALQSQLYSEYKSSTTLKALIGCDPSGSVLFVSELFTGAISDKAITERSGFYDVLKTLKAHGYIKDGDAVMAHKGFQISEELKEIGLCLNILPFAASGSQMPQTDVELTCKIAHHRVHIERLISKVKTIKILSDRIPTTLFKTINQIWSVCCYLTLLQDVFVTDKMK